MKLAVYISSNCFLALILGCYCVEKNGCDTKWVRFVYMMSCGKKKRESTWSENDSFYSKIPQNFDEAFKYFKERDPQNPVFKNERLLQQILKEEESTPPKYPILLLAAAAADTIPSVKENSESKQSILIQKLLPKIRLNNNHLGIQGFPEQWSIEEIHDEKINENYRRGIDELVEQCCKVTSLQSCNITNFVEACK